MEKMTEFLKHCGELPLVALFIALQIISFNEIYKNVYGRYAKYRRMLLIVSFTDLGRAVIFSIPSSSYLVSGFLAEFLYINLQCVSKHFQ